VKPLSRKQAAIMAAIVDDGMRGSQIAREWGMSESTVATYYLRVRRKLGAKTLAQAAAIFAVNRLKDAI
jgi:DNA-binding CsgD family transcriptional regulator